MYTSDEVITILQRILGKNNLSTSDYEYFSKQARNIGKFIINPVDIETEIERIERSNKAIK